VLRLENICVRLGEFRLREVSLHVKPGTYLALLGPTGTGKTVLLETIAGVHHPSSGRIHIRGQDATGQAPEKRHLGIVYQDYVLFPHLSVFDNIAFGLRLHGTPRPQIKQAVEKMAAFLEIEPLLKRRPNRLSGGERQRTALARALVMEPYVLLLDEPLSALDRATSSRIQAELKRIHTELGVTIIHITHNVAEAFFLADRLAVMKDGRILQEGLPAEVCRYPISHSVAELMGIENLIAATVENGRLVTAMGDLALPRLATGGNNLPPQVCVTLPGESVELFPAGNPEDYIWRGNLRIAEVHQMNGTGMFKLILVHDHGECLKTYLSPREAHTLAASLKVGQSLPVGLLGKGAHWVPQEVST
jgi:ABC-type Fe3+/spermidine/putrescine transport system ATPase subunit